MKAPLLANHCIMEGFEDLEDDEAATEEATEAVKELLPINELAKVEIAKKSPEGVFVISVPEISEGLKDIDEITTTDTVAQGPSASVAEPVTPAPLPPAEKVRSFFCFYNMGCSYMKGRFRDPGYYKSCVTLPSFL